MTGGILLTLSHYFLQNTMKKIAPSVLGRLPGTGEKHNFWRQRNVMKRHRVANNRLSS